MLTLREQITEIVEEWLPIETAPKNKPILLGAYGLEGFLEMSGYWADTDWYFIGGGWMGVQPTHWRPLHAPPATTPSPSPTPETERVALVRREDAARVAELVNDSIRDKGKFASAILMMPPYPAPDCPICGYSIDSEGLCVLDAAHTAKTDNYNDGTI